MISKGMFKTLIDDITTPTEIDGMNMTEKPTNTDLKRKETIKNIETKTKLSVLICEEKRL
jgi:hypothetical protein